MNNSLSGVEHVKKEDQAYYDKIKQIPVLSQEEEKSFFRQYRICLFAAELSAVMTGTKVTKRDIQKVKDHITSDTINDKDNPDVIDAVLGKTSEEIRSLADKKKLIRNKLANHNLRLAFAIAGQLFHHDFPFDDMIQNANLGLLKAIDRYDYTAGTKFSTYATWWIRQSIKREKQITENIIGIPTNKAVSLGEIEKFKAEYYTEHQKEPTDEEIAGYMDISVEKLHRIYGSNIIITSLDTPVSAEEGESTTLMQMIEDEDSASPEETAMNLFLGNSIDDILKDILTEKERYVIIRRYNLDGNGVATLQELGTHFNLTRERIRQIELCAIAKLQGCPEMQKLKDAFLNE